MKFKPYPEYKDSGVEWIGEIPKDWNVEKLKLNSEINLNSLPENYDLDYEFFYLDISNVSKNGEIINTELMRFEDAPSRARRIPKSKNTIISTVRTYLKAIAYLDDIPKNFIVSTGFSVLDPHKNIFPRYLYYLVSSDLFVQTVVAYSKGISYPAINSSDLANLPIWYPDIETQNKISSFLDKKTSEIDLTIEKDTRLIELLKEKRTALINHVVTKGLDPTVKMKDSGVEWIGYIPEEWELKKIKHLVHRIIDTEHKTAPFYLNGKYLVVRTSNIRNGGLILKDAKYTDYDGFKMWTRRGLPESGDILFTREAPAGEACLVPADVNLCIGQRIVLFKINKNKLNSQFGVYSLYSSIADQFISSLSQGSTVTHFNMADIGNIPLFVPSIEEQEKIVDYLEKETSKINQIINKVENNINLLEEYKKSLIHHVVTGKVNVIKED